MNGPTRAEKGWVDATLHARVLIALRGCQGDCYGSRCSVRHSGNDTDVVTFPTDVPHDGVSVEQEVQQLIDCRVHHGQDFAQLYSSILMLDSDRFFSWQ